MAADQRSAQQERLRRLELRAREDRRQAMAEAAERCREENLAYQLNAVWRPNGSIWTPPFRAGDHAVRLARRQSGDRREAKEGRGVAPEPGILGLLLLRAAPAAELGAPTLIYPVLVRSREVGRVTLTRTGHVVFMAKGKSYGVLSGHVFPSHKEAIEAVSAHRPSVRTGPAARTRPPA